MEWRVLLSTKTTNYLIGMYKRTVLLGSIGESIGIDRVNENKTIGMYMYNHRILGRETRRLHAEIEKLASGIPLVKTSVTFDCAMCDTKSTVTTSIPCLHVLCSECVAQCQYTGTPCPVCAAPIRGIRSLLYGIPIPHILRIIQLIGEPIQYIVDLNLSTANIIS